MEAGRGWKATLYSRANLSMIHQVTATGDTNPGGPLNSGTYSISIIISVSHHTHTQMEIVKLEAPWIDVHTLVVL